jgi:hypothetical protein
MIAGEVGVAGGIGARSMRGEPRLALIDARPGSLGAV